MLCILYNNIHINKHLAVKAKLFQIGSNSSVQLCSFSLLLTQRYGKSLQWRGTVRDFLKDIIQLALKLYIVSAYFTIFVYEQW